MKKQENEFERELKEMDCVIQWIGEHIDELDVTESLITLGAYRQLVSTLMPIYRKHNSVKFTFDFREEK